MRVLVFGANGYIGRHLVDSLRTQDGVDVMVAGVGNGMDPVHGHLVGDYSLPAGVDTVIYLSQSPYWREGALRFDHVLAVNCATPVRLAELANRAGVRRFLFASTGTVYQADWSALNERSPVNRTDWYALSKLYAEEALQNQKGAMTVSCLRFFGVYGPRQEGRLLSNLAKRITAGLPVTLEKDSHANGFHGTRLTMTHIDDLIQVLGQLTKIDCLPPVLNVASDHSASIREIAVGVSEALCRPAIFEEAKSSVSGYFVADVTRMQQIVPQRFMPFCEGVAAMTGPADFCIS